MARMRTLKPGFFTSEGLAPGHSFRARLLFAGLWTYCDDHGRGKDNARLIKADIFPLDDDVSPGAVDNDLDALALSGHVVRYTVGGARYLAVQNWHFHQSPNRPSESVIPAPPVPIAVPEPGKRNHCEPCWTVHTQLTEPSLIPHEQLIAGMGGKGREKEWGEGERASATEPPSPRCPQHVDNPNPPPCGRCKDARQARERWDRDVKEAAKDAGLAIRRCRMCDPDGYEYEPGTRIPKTPWVRCEHRPLRSVS